MKIRSASVAKSCTVNLGDFNSHKVEIGMSVDFDEGDNPDAGMSTLISWVNSRLANEITQITSGSAKTPKKQTLMETLVETAV